MPTKLRLETTILPGHRLEISNPELPEGAKVEVIVVQPEKPKNDRMSMLEFLTTWAAPLQTSRGSRPLHSGGTRRMGALTLPTSGLIYIDTVTLIYTVERF